MAIYKYTLPSGAEFRVEVPEGTTQSQADRIFYSQVAAGSLVGYSKGQTLTSEATRLATFELSRLERGTAGVENPTTLSVIQNLPTVAGIPTLSAVPIENPIDEADIVMAKGDDLGPRAAGTLDVYDTQKVMAQIINFVDQPFDQISNGKGLGKYGLTCLSLEQAGYVKPGTTQKYFVDRNNDFVTIMNTPSIWTGKDGITSLDQSLANEETQNRIQNNLMIQSFQELMAAGVISMPRTSAVSINTGEVAVSVNSSATAITRSNMADVGALIANASKFGVGAVADWAKSGASITSQLGSLTQVGSQLQNIGFANVNQITKGLTNLVPGSLGNLTSSLDKLGKAAQFSVNFANPLDKLGNLNVQSLTSGALKSAQGLATNALGNLQGQATALAGQLTGQATALAGQLQGLAGGGLTSISNLGSVFGGGGDLVSGTKVAAAFNNTVNRKTVDAAFTRALGSAKIPTPNFEFPSPASLGAKLDVAQAQNILKNLQSQAGSALGQASALANQARGAAGQAGQIFGQSVTI